MRYEGYCTALPIKRGDTVTIRKGVTVRYRGVSFPAGRTHKVKVDHTLCGITLSREDIAYAQRHGGCRTTNENPKIVWASTGSYWAEVDINDIPEAQ